ncbi:MAG: glycosyltransferase family 4 protein [Lautropia sp.]
MPDTPTATRLAILIHSLSAGGAERVAVHLANGFAARRWQVALLTLEPAAGDFYAVDARVDRIGLDVAGPAGGLVGALAGNARRLRAIRRALARGRYDAVLALTAEVSVLAILATRGLGLRVVVSERIHPPALRLGRAWHRLRRLVYPHADQVVVQTEDTRRWIERHTPGARARVIPNPVVLPLPGAEPRLPPAQLLGPDRRLLLAVGRLSPQKGFDLLIPAFSRIAADHPAWTLVILGEGAERTALEALVAAHGQQARVLLPGHAGNLEDWYRRASLFVLSSRFEGFPNALVEAMAHGCPAVAFDCPTGPRDLVRDGVDGVLVTATDSADALSGALARAMGDDALRARLSSRATEVAARFDPDTILEHWERTLLSR